METVKKIHLNFRKWVTANPYAAGFFAVSLVFLIFNTEINFWSGLLPFVEFCSVLNAALFFLYSLIFLGSRNRFNRNSRLLLKAIFVLTLLDLIAIFPATGMSNSIYVILNTLTSAGAVLVYAFVVVVFLFLISLSLLLFKLKHKAFGYFFILFSIAVFLIPYYAIYNTHLVPSDEVFVTFVDSKLLLQGVNPYSNDVAALLASNYTSGKVTSPTYTMSNEIIGVLNYPALFLFSSIPFYLVSSQSPNAFSLATKLQVGAFLAILLLVISYCAGREYYKKPLLGVAFFIAFMLNGLSSPVDFLMLAFLILAYAKLESRYSWILLGICLALQQLLWLPVLLLIAYSANNHGWKKGIYNLLGSLAIFLLLNSYFIIIGPQAFIHGVFSPLSNIIPESGGPLGYLISIVYGTPISSTGAILGTAALISVITFLCMNNKKTIAILGLLPFEFLTHDLQFYPTFFLAFAFAILYLKEREPGGYGFIGGWLRKHKIMLSSMIGAILLFSAAILIYAHIQYSNQFEISASPLNSSLNLSTNAKTYATVLEYRNLSDYNLSIFLFGTSSNGPGFFGFTNASIINGSLACPPQDYQCRINVNQIKLNPENSTYALRIRVYLPKNESIYRAAIVLYNSKYAYFSNSTT